jgi:hypothetical protein
MRANPIYSSRELRIETPPDRPRWTLGLTPFTRSESLIGLLCRRPILPSADPIDEEQNAAKNGICRIAVAVFLCRGSTFNIARITEVNAELVFVANANDPSRISARTSDIVLEIHGRVPNASW